MASPPDASAPTTTSSECGDAQHLAHAADADERHDFVRTEPRAGADRHLQGLRARGGYFAAAFVTSTRVAFGVAALSSYVTVTTSPMFSRSAIEALPPFFSAFVPSPLPITRVFASTAKVWSLPPALTVNAVADTDFTVALAAICVLADAGTAVQASVKTAASTIHAERTRFIAPPL